MPPDSPTQSIQVASDSSSRPKVEMNDGKYVIHPPKDSGLSMTVLEHRQPVAARGPASAVPAKPLRTIEVIVSAP